MVTLREYNPYDGNGLLKFVGVRVMSLVIAALRCWKEVVASLVQIKVVL